MADPTATSDATSDPAATAGAATTDPPASTSTDELGDAGKRAIAEVRKELKQAQKERDELIEAERVRKDGERSEIEKATAERDAHKQRVAELEHEALAREVATDAGIPKDWQRLKGSTKDELEADAKQFVEDHPPAGGAAPRPDLGAGARQQVPATGSAGFSERIRRQSGRG